ncbi:MAG: FemAB family XrtA/PEP-CTERM system-associated protein [Pseudomonadales bacterium]
MTEVCIITAGDYSRWDDYVRSKGEAAPYHLTAWKQAVEAAYGHRGFYLLAEDGGKITGVLPLCALKPPIIRGTLCSLPFCDMGGYLYDNDDAKDALFRKALEITKDHKLKKLEIRQGYIKSESEHSITVDGAQATKVQMGMALPSTSEELWSKFKPKLRSQIRKAEKNGLTYSQGKSVEDITAFYNVYAVNMKKLGSPAHSLRWFLEIGRYYGECMLVGLVRLQDTVVGAGIVLLVGHKATIPWASTLSPYNKYAPNMLLYWSLLKNSCDTDCRHFDFGRSTYGEGTYKFKAQWGATPATLDWRDYTPSGDEIKSAHKAPAIRPIIENVWSKAPLPLANSLGHRVRKYISL